jgi:Cof subfamily protein (haloacid dehalogenase superfamily)
MGKTLYISDLDGTLLTPQATFSPFTVDIVNRFIESGGQFTVATGRTFQMTKKIIEPLNLRLPVAVSNGAMLYDPLADEFVRVVDIPRGLHAEMAEIFRAAGVTGFFFVLEGKDVSIYHAPLIREVERKYCDFRRGFYEGRIYEEADIVRALESRQVFFGLVYGPRGELEPVRQELEGLGLELALHGDVYNPGIFFLDIHSQVNKADAMRTIAQAAGARRMVAFGDNGNAIPMFAAADESYATANAVDIVKEAATAVIGPNTDDGVAKFIAERFGL